MILIRRSEIFSRRRLRRPKCGEFHTLRVVFAHYGAVTELLRIDPTLPVVWRNPHTFSIGVHPPLVTVTGVDDRVLALLHALTTGVSLAGALAIGEHAGMTSADVHECLKTLSPVLTARKPRPLPSVGIVSSVVHTAHFAQVFSDLGHSVSTSAGDSSNGEEMILLAHFVLPASRYRTWLSGDRVHTPVRFSDQTIVIGPRITPGIGPCMRCVWENDKEGEPDLLALSTQLSVMKAASDTPELATLAAWHTSRLISTTTPGLTLGIDVYSRGVDEWVEPVSPHCLCGDIGHRVEPRT